MPITPRHLRQLEKELAGLPGDGEAMLVSELDGFLTGVLVCPDLIMPSQWLPLVWGDGDDEAAPVFESTTHAQKLIGLVTQHYNAIATDLQCGRFAPVFDVDRRHDEVLWELWIDGFEKARLLSPQSWLAIAGGDAEARTAFAGLITLAAISRGDSSLAQAEIHDLTEKAPELIPRWVESLNAWRISQHFAGQPENPKPLFVGRPN